MNKKNLRKGFTTVELVIVIAVIAILATALIPTFGGLIDKANETKYMNAARQVFNDVLAGEATTGNLPASTTTWYICVVNSGDGDDAVFKVENGQFVSTALTSSEVTTVKGTTGAIVYKAQTGTPSYTTMTAETIN